MSTNAVSFPDVHDMNPGFSPARFAVVNLGNRNVGRDDEIRSQPRLEGIVGLSPALGKVLDLVETVASSDSTVLLLGETGTGKELVARAIHDRSNRRTRTMVKLNCAAIPTGLLESELFGHERGAFTGAIMQKTGRLELADQGTLFLDEVGDIPLELQPKLLRALQEREFERLGSTRTKKVDVRLIAATNCDLDRMMAEKRFRSDLYYRLNVFPIRIPPLRERSEDIPVLVRHFVDKYAGRMQKTIDTIPSTAMRELMRWHWPGNVRELENLVERAVILTCGRILALSPPDTTRGDAESSRAPGESSEEQDRILRILGNLFERAMTRRLEVAPASAILEPSSGAIPAIYRMNVTGYREQDRIVQILRDTNGRVGGPNGAAVRLGLKRTTLITRMKRLGIAARRVI